MVKLKIKYPKLFPYSQLKHSEPIDDLLETFRSMVNEAVRVALEQRITSKFTLIKTVYESFKRYGLHTHYILSVCEVAYWLIRNKKEGRTHTFTKPLKLDNQTFKIEGGILRIPMKPRQFLKIPLGIGEYQRCFLFDSTLKNRLSHRECEHSYGGFLKDPEVIEPKGYVAIDTNEKS